MTLGFFAVSCIARDLPVPCDHTTRGPGFWEVFLWRFGAGLRTVDDAEAASSAAPAAVLALLGVALKLREAEREQIEADWLKALRAIGRCGCR